MLLLVSLQPLPPLMQSLLPLGEDDDFSFDGAGGMPRPHRVAAVGRRRHGGVGRRRYCREVGSDK